MTIKGLELKVLGSVIKKQNNKGTILHITHSLLYVTLYYLTTQWGNNILVTLLCFVPPTEIHRYIISSKPWARVPLACTNPYTNEEILSFSVKG